MLIRFDIERSQVFMAARKALGVCLPKSKEEWRADKRERNIHAHALLIIPSKGREAMSQPSIHPI